ncbi:MAG: hypothetical protein ABIE70_07660 [bacterium]
MDFYGAKSRRLHLILTVLVVVGGFVFWVSDLNSDPPMYYAGLGQSLATDPAQYVYHARNEVLFGDWDPYDYPRWTVYQHSLTSLVAWVVFSIWGVTLAKAGLVGVILSFGGLVMFLTGLWRTQRPWVVSAVALCWVGNVSLLTYGRLAYLENGLLFWAGALYLVFCWWGNRRWGAVACGLLVALAAFTGKIFGLLLIGPLLLAYATGGQTQRWRQVLATVGGFGVAAAVVLLSLYGSDIGAAFGYAGEQSYGLRGFPAGLSSPWAFVEHLISYGFGNRIWYVDPDLFVFGVVGLATLILMPWGATKPERLSPSVKLVTGWAGLCFLALMPLNYSPLRYALIMFPALIVLVFITADSLLSHKRITMQPPGKVKAAALAALAWFAAYHLIRNLAWFNSPAPESLVWYCLPVGIGVALAVRWLTERFHVRLTRTGIGVGLAILLLFVVISNGFRIRRYHYLDHNYGIAEAANDLEQLLGPDAVVSGPYGPVLTTDTKLGSFIYLFAAVAEVDQNLFGNHPVTHIAVDVSNLVQAKEHYPALDSARHVSSYWIRDVEVGIYRVGHLFGNESAGAYQPSHFEKAQDWLRQQQPDSAWAELRLHLDSRQTTKSAAMLLADLQLRSGQFGAAMQTMTAAARECPTDFYVQLQCGRLYLLAGLSQNDQYLINKAREYFEAGVAVNRYKADYAMQLADQTTRLARPTP